MTFLYRALVYMLPGILLFFEWLIHGPRTTKIIELGSPEICAAAVALVLPVLIPNWEFHQAREPDGMVKDIPTQSLADRIAVQVGLLWFLFSLAAYIYILWATQNPDDAKEVLSSIDGYDPRFVMDLIAYVGAVVLTELKSRS